MPSTSYFQLEPAWQLLLKQEFESSYMCRLSDFLIAQEQENKDVYPAKKDIFNALNSTSFDKVRVVILGQDPYHGPGQAHGLSFSVPADVSIPPSLRNIYKELEADCQIELPQHGHLQNWADQGVLLLNSVMTVESGLAGSHQGKGWETFTDAVIRLLSERRDSIVFMLWGSYAQKKGASIDSHRHLVLKAPHPSPLSAYRGFFGCAHFSKANQYLEDRHQTPINWQI